MTLNLTGKGGVDEASWRVTKDFNWDFTADDIYIGYRIGSMSDIQVKLPTDHGWFDGCTWRVQGSMVRISRLMSMIQIRIRFELPQGKRILVVKIT